jgi:hypothetical protein
MLAHAKLGGHLSANNFGFFKLAFRSCIPDSDFLRAESNL